jgi:hypothetical protein
MPSLINYNIYFKDLSKYAKKCVIPLEVTENSACPFKSD